jgi:hypothetical protein
MECLPQALHLPVVLLPQLCKYAVC